MRNPLFIQLLVILALVIIGWLVSVAVAIAKGVFDWDKFPKFILKAVVPYVIVWGALASLKVFGPRIGLEDEALTVYYGFIQVIYAGIILVLGRSILKSLSELGITNGGAVPLDPNAGK